MTTTRRHHGLPRLPSKDEQHQLYLRSGIVGGFILSGYWSSSESTGNLAWLQDFYDGNDAATGDKSYPSYVRPIRAF